MPIIFKEWVDLYKGGYEPKFDPAIKSGPKIELHAFYVIM